LVFVHAVVVGVAATIAAKLFVGAAYNFFSPHSGHCLELILLYFFVKLQNIQLQTTTNDYK